ncbi:MAG: hypothetical protein JSV65_03610 [Armatimonadota bacterium]|nr:MAG: hypothetical protein JSV65_03610 [Armatimonadota bacterium]
MRPLGHARVGGEPAPAAETRQATAGRFVLLESAVRAGHATSDAVVKQFGTADPLRLAEAIGIRLELKERCRDNPRLRSEVLADPPTIVLYVDALGELSRLLALRAPRLNSVPLDTIAVAIELYRYLERGRRDLLRGVKPGWPRVAREVAAHAFAQDLLELPFFPAEIDAVDRLARTPIHLGVRRG